MTKLENQLKFLLEIGKVKGILRQSVVLGNKNRQENGTKYANVFNRFQGFMQNITSNGHTWRKFTPTMKMVVDRIEPTATYAPKLYKEIVYKSIAGYTKNRIIN